MKKIISRLTNTYKAIQLLSNPEVASLFYYKKNTNLIESAVKKTSTLGRGDLFIHKHFMVQVVN